MIEQVALAFGTLFSIVNPFSTAFVLESLVRKKEAVYTVAWQASLVACLVLLGFLGIGPLLLRFFGITIYAFRVAGGLYLGMIAFEMLGKRLRNEPEHFEEAGPEISIIPIAIPLLSGPGAMTAVLVLTDSYTAGAIIVAILLVCLISWLVLRQSLLIARALGRTGTNVVERVLGLIVLVIAVQFLFNGITGYLATL